MAASIAEVTEAVTYLLPKFAVFKEKLFELEQVISVRVENSQTDKDKGRSITAHVRLVYIDPDAGTKTTREQEVRYHQHCSPYTKDGPLPVLSKVVTLSSKEDKATAQEIERKRRGQPLRDPPQGAARLSTGPPPAAAVSEQKSPYVARKETPTKQSCSCQCHSPSAGEFVMCTCSCPQKPNTPATPSNASAQAALASSAPKEARDNAPGFIALNDASPLTFQKREKPRRTFSSSPPKDHPFQPAHGEPAAAESALPSYDEAIFGNSPQGSTEEIDTPVPPAVIASAPQASLQQKPPQPPLPLWAAGQITVAAPRAPEEYLRKYIQQEIRSDTQLLANVQQAVQALQETQAPPAVPAIQQLAPLLPPVAPVLPVTTPAAPVAAAPAQASVPVVVPTPPKGPSQPVPQKGPRGPAREQLPVPAPVTAPMAPHTPTPTPQQPAAAPHPNQNQPATAKAPRKQVNSEPPRQAPPPQFAPAPPAPAPTAPVAPSTSGQNSADAKAFEEAVAAIENAREAQLRLVQRLRGTDRSEEVERLREELRRSHEDVTRLQEDLEDLRRQLSEHADPVADLERVQRTMGFLQSELVTKVVDLRHATQKCEELQSQVEELRKQLSGQSPNVETAQSPRKEIELRLRMLHEKNVRLNKEMENANKLWTEERALREAQENRHHGEIAALRRELDELRAIKVETAPKDPRRSSAVTPAVDGKPRRESTAPEPPAKRPRP
eukprot:TRINITY_DN12611_c0_g1_i1.p1 TRINITY_DN12611_c0_g1~~TRINITY_DN12611_c0_g1_i1.p1  ORF type:complete len:731 (-),score=117.75 TRINITY_DN12611_c0_g1_i1:43-2214(-)